VFYEETARRGLTGMATSVHSIVAHYLLNHGTDAQKARYLPRMARGELVGAIAMTEPAPGPICRAAHARRTARRPLRDRRQQDLHHERLPRRPGARRLQDRCDAGRRGTSILIVETEAATASASAACSTSSA
jgi:acyl-CoA dehydrogenase